MNNSDELMKEAITNHKNTNKKSRWLDITLSPYFVI